MHHKYLEPNPASWLFTSFVVVVQFLSHVQLFATPWTPARQASLSFRISRSLLKYMSIELMMPSNNIMLCHPLCLLLSIFPSIRIFSSESALRIRWPKYWSFSLSIRTSNKYSQFISFRIDCFDLLAVKGTQESSPAQFQSINSLMLSLMVQHPYMTTSKVTVLTI